MQSGLVVDGYTLDRHLGSGAHGEVWSGRGATAAAVAVKFLKAELLGDPDLPRRFRREVRLAQAIVSPHVVRCLGGGEHQGHLYLISELVTGGDVEGLMRRHGGRLSRPLALAALADTLRGLAAIHAAGLIHRDIKPANVMLDAGGTAKVADLGLARPTDAARTRYTGEGMIVGSPAYLSPEAIRADVDLDIRSDLYAAGVMVWQCLTGSLPFAGTSVFDVLRLHLEAPVPKLADSLPGCPADLAGLVGDLLAKDRNRRPSTPQEALDRLLPLAQADGAATIDSDLLATQALAYPATLPEGSAAPVYAGTISDGGAAFPSTIPDGGAAFPVTIPDGASAYPPTIPDGAASFPATIPDRGGSPDAFTLGGFAPAGGGPTVDAGAAPTVPALPIVAEEVLSAAPGGPALASAKLVIPGMTLFVCAGPRLQCGRDARDFGTGNQVCLRLLPAAAHADATRRISGRHLGFNAQADGITVEDLGSSQGTRVDGLALVKGQARPLGDGAVIGVGGVLDLAVQVGPCSGRYRCEGVGASSTLASALLRRRGNREDQAYLLVGGAVRLARGADGTIRLGDGPVEFVALGGGLWFRAGPTLHPLYPGAILPWAEQSIPVAALAASDQKE